MAALKQDFAKVYLIHHMAGLVGDLDGTAVEGAAMQQFLTQDFARRRNGLLPRGFRIGQFLAFFIAVQRTAFADMEVIAGHGLGFAA
jgi:hypothetical protein